MKALINLFICLILVVSFALPGISKQEENLFLPLFYNQAVSAYKSGSLDEAIDYINKSISLKPTEVSNLILSAQFQLDKNPEESIQILNKALKILPSDSLIRFLLGNAYEKNNDLANSLEYYKLVYLSEPDNILFLSSIGRVYFLMEDYESAIKNLNRVIAVYPENIKARLILAVSYHFLREYNIAEDFYKQCLTVLDDPLIWYNLSKAQLALGNYPESKGSLNEAIRLDNLKVEFYLDRAQINYQLSLLEEAENDYHQALKLEPQNPVASVEYAEFLWHTQAYLRAIDQFKRASELQPHDVNIISSKAYLLQILGKTYEAANAWKDVLDIEPNNQIAEFNLAKLYFNNTEYNEAISLYTKLLSLKLSKETESRVKRYLAASYRAVGQYENAKQVYIDSLKQDSNNAELCFDYAKMLQESENYTESVSYFNKSLVLGIANKKLVYSSLISLYQKLNEPENVKNTYNDWLTSDNSNIDARISFAAYLSMIGESKSAIEQYRVIAALDKNGESKLKLAEFLKEYGSLDEATEELNEYISNHPNNLNALILLANLYKDSDHQDEAIEVYRKIVSIQPDSYIAYFNLGVLMQKKSNLTLLGFTIEIIWIRQS